MKSNLSVIQLYRPVLMYKHHNSKKYIITEKRYIV